MYSVGIPPKNHEFCIYSFVKTFGTLPTMYVSRCSTELVENNSYKEQTPEKEWNTTTYKWQILSGKWQFETRENFEI